MERNLLVREYNCNFSARVNGRTVKREFKNIAAPDTYTASDKIKELLGAQYAQMTHPVFQFGIARKAMPRGLARIVANAGPEEE